MTSTTLPQELWLECFAFLDLRSDTAGNTGHHIVTEELLDLALVCRAFWSILRPRLWQRMHLFTGISNDQVALDRLLDLLTDVDIRSYIAHVYLGISTNVFGDLSAYHQAVKAIFACPNIQELRVFVDLPRDADAANLPTLRQVLRGIITTPSRLEVISWQSLARDAIPAEYLFRVLADALGRHSKTMRSIKLSGSAESEATTIGSGIDLSAILRFPALSHLALSLSHLHLTSIIVPRVEFTYLRQVEVAEVSVAWLCNDFLPAVASSLEHLDYTIRQDRGIYVERELVSLPKATFDMPRLRRLSLRLYLRSPRSALPASLIRFFSLAPISHLFLSIEVESTPMSTALVPYGTIAAPVDPLQGYDSIAEILTDVFVNRVGGILSDERVLPELSEVSYAVTMSDGEVGNRWIDDDDELSTRFSSLSIASEEYGAMERRMATRGVRLISALV